MDLLEFRPYLVCNNVGSLELKLTLNLTINLTLNLGILHYFIPERGETPGDPSSMRSIRLSIIHRVALSRNVRCGRFLEK